MVIRPRSLPLASTTSSFSMRLACNSSLEFSRLVPSGTVISFLVIMALTGCSRLRSKRTSRLVMMPTARPSLVTTGNPEISCRFINSRAWASFWSAPMVTGLTTTPVSAFLTFCTSSACSAMEKFLWMTPMPPSRAMQMAVAASVTVSMADDTMGIASLMDGVNCVRTSVSLGTTSLSAGTSRTSSKVSASRRGPSGNISGL